MASKSYPRAGYNSGALTELEHERLVHGQAPDGLNGTPTGPSLVYADGTGTRVVKIRSGRRALVRGSQYDSGDTDISMPSLAANASGQPRIDLIVLRLNRSDYTITEAAITGTPAASPTAPSPLADAGATGSFDLPVAQVRVENGATVIASDKVTDVAWYVGSDGQILCTPTTRPPHEAGRRIYEPATGVASISTGSSWVVVYEDSGPLSFTMASGWALSFGSLRRRNGTVAASLSVRRTGGNLGVSGDVQVATLPAGLQPLSNVEGPAHVLNVGPTIGAYGSNRAITARLSSGISTNNYVILSPATWHVA